MDFINGLISRTLKVRGGIISQVDRYIDGFCFSQSTFPPQIIQVLLIEKVKPELNHIYTEKPFVMTGGGDFGWFCREHALHLYGVATLLGKNAEICVGDVLLRLPQGNSFHSIGVPSGHAWCCIDELAPVDVSLTLKYIYPDLSDVRLIYGERSDLAASFHLQYLVNESAEVFPPTW
jgi:hypothetical protein